MRKTKTMNVQHTNAFLADFFEVIAQIMSNLIRMAMQSSQLRFCWKYPYKGSDLKTSTDGYLNKL